MASRRAVAAGAAVAFVAVAVGTFVVARSGNETHVAAALDAAAAPSVPRVAAHRFVPGRETTYAVAYASDGTLRAGDSSSASHLVSKLRARFVRTVLGPAAREGHQLVLYRFDEAEITIAIDESPRATDAARVTADLARGFVVEMTPSGALASLRVDPAAASLTRAFARTLAAWTQVTLAPEAESSWRARETDSNGPYLAEYAVVPSPTATELLALRKTKRALGARDGERVVPAIVFVRAETGSTAIVEIDFDRVDGEVREIAGDESIDATLGGQPLAHAKATFDAERTTARTLDAPALTALAADIAPLVAAPPTALDAHDGDASDSASADANRHWLGGATLPEIARGLDDEAREPHEGRRFDLFLKLKAYASLNPADCAAMAQLLRARPPRGSASATIVAALAAAGSKEAQAALVGVVMARGASDDERMRVVPSLGMLSSPLPETEDAVRRIRDTSRRADVAQTAALALGIMARSIAAMSPARAARIVDDALARLARDESDEAAVRFDLTVLGNTGSSRIVDDVVRVSRSASPAVRAQAAFALRFVASDAAEARLLELLAGDVDAQVRARAANALSYRELTTTSGRAQRARAVEEPDDAVRAEIARTLAAAGER